MVPGRALRGFVPVHDAPLTHVWRATGVDGEALTIQVVRARALALAPDRERVALHLASAVGFDQSPYRPLWVECLADGRVAYATPWVDRIPAVDAVRDTLLHPSALAVTTATFLAALAEVHRHGGVLGIIAPTALAFVPGLNTFTVDGAGVFAALVAAGARREEVARVAGVPAHVAPELLAPEGIADARVDVYSVGTTLYELLTERAPFGGRTTAMMMVSILVQTDTQEMAAPGGPVREMVDALLRAIERDPEDRWPSMAAFAAALDGSPAAGWITTPMSVPRMTAAGARATNSPAAAEGAGRRSRWHDLLARLRRRA